MVDNGHSDIMKCSSKLVHITSPSCVNRLKVQMCLIFVFLYPGGQDGKIKEGKDKVCPCGCTSAKWLAAGEVFLRNYAKMLEEWCLLQILFSNN